MGTIRMEKSELGKTTNYHNLFPINSPYSPIHTGVTVHSIFVYIIQPQSKVSTICLLAIYYLEHGVAERAVLEPGV